MIFAIPEPLYLRLLAATPLGESAVEILQAAARDYVPIKPSRHTLVDDTRQDPTLNQPIPSSHSRPSIEQILREITGEQSEDYEKEDINEYVGLEWYKGQIAYRRTFEATPSRLGINYCLNGYPFDLSYTYSLGTLLTPLSANIRNALKTARNISSLYSHQADAINLLDESSNVVVSTRTASGKSVIYQVKGPFDS